MVKKGLKVVTRILWAILALTVIFVIINQFDAGKNPGDFTEKDVPQANFDKNNGYYRLWALSEPEGVDIDSDPVIDKYRKFYYPEYNKQYVDEFDHKAYRAMFSKKDKDLIKQTFHDTGLNWTLYRGNWSDKVLAARDEITVLKRTLAPLLDNYRKFIVCDVIEDFSSFRMAAPIPNLLAYLHASRVYNLTNMLDALDGNWQTGVANILTNAVAAKKAIKGSRILITNLIGKAVLRDSVYNLADLMNREDFPPELFETVYRGLPPITYEEFGSAPCFIFEYLTAADLIDHYPGDSDNSFVLGLFLQENRTKKYLFDFYTEMIEYEKMPPYRWQSPIKPVTDYRSGPFWWLQNFAGKLLYSDFVPNIPSVITRTYYTKSLYDMVRTAAELHMKYDSQKPVSEHLNELESHKTLDPYSGKPYVWNQEKQVFYGIGPDKKDDGGGAFDYTEMAGDVTVPCILYIK